MWTLIKIFWFHILSFSHKSCPTVCDPMDRSTSGLPVSHHLPEFAQTHVHWSGGAILLSHPLLPPSPPALSFFQHQGLFKWVSSSHQAAKILELQLQHKSFQIWKGWFPFGLTGLISFLSKGLSRVFSSTTVWEHKFFSTEPYLWANPHIFKWLLKKTLALTRWIFVSKVMSLFFNMLSRLIITFLPRSKCLLISWLQSPSTMILEPQKRKFVTASTFSPSICMR